MRSLTLLAPAALTLLALAALPLSAHDHWRDRRPAVVIEEPCRSYGRWEARRWENRWEPRAYRRGYDCDEGRYVSRRDDCDEGRVYLRSMPRPLLPPFEGRVVLHFR
jgi:hypothetical protein